VSAPNAPSPKASTRLDALESVRGLAALVVVFHHLALTFWPAAYTANSPLRFLLDGKFAVSVFFVLSGVVLSYSFFNKPSRNALGSATIRRYFRLTPPILASVLVAYGLMAAGAFANAPLAAAVGRDDPWLRDLYDFEPSLTGAVKEGLYGVYVDYHESQTYNNVLWTMRTELFGSLFVFVLQALFGTLPRRWVLYLLIGAGLYGRYRFFLDFLVGVAVCDCYLMDRGRRRPIAIGAWGGAVLLAAGVVIGSVLPDSLRPVLGFSPRKFDTQTVGAILVIGTALFCPFWRRQLESGWLVWLGRLSFSLYLLHLSIICSLGCRTFLALYVDHGWPYHWAAVASSAVAVPTSLAAAWVMTRLVDQRAIALGWVVYRLFDPPRPAPAAGRSDRLQRDELPTGAVAEAPGSPSPAAL
jgi:peptidoglycan/LPS O-acetylase OafA/YrhL